MSEEWVFALSFLAVAISVASGIWFVVVLTRIERHLREIRTEVAAMRGHAFAISDSTAQTAAALRRVAE